MAIHRDAERVQGCKDCLYWIKGTCRKHAPISNAEGPLIIRHRESLPIDIPDQLSLEPGRILMLPQEMEVAYGGGWPVTQADDWCGDFKISPYKPE